jgi:hypothetical protein
MAAECRCLLSSSVNVAPTRLDHRRRRRRSGLGLELRGCDSCLSLFPCLSLSFVKTQEEGTKPEGDLSGSGEVAIGYTSLSQ